MKRRFVDEMNIQSPSSVSGNGLPAQAPDLSASPSPSTTVLPAPSSSSRATRTSSAPVASFIDAATVVLFLLALAVACVLTLCENPSDVSSLEKRNRTPAPPLPTDRQSLATFPQDFSAYFNDNLAQRNRLISLYALTKIDLLHESANDRVLAGQQGWLFYRGSFDKADELSDYRGVRRLSDDQVNLLREQLLARRDLLAARGIKYILMVCPNKSTLYPEFLPPAYQIRFDSQTPLDRLKAALQHDNLIFVDPRDRLFAAKQKSSSPPLYYKTDTHWNELGGYEGYAALLSAMEQVIPEVSPLTPAQIIVKSSVSSDTPGDLEMLMGVDAKIPDYQVTVDVAPGAGDPSMAVNSSEDEDFGHVDIAQANTISAKPKLMMLHDSFLGGMSHLLLAGGHFSRCVFVGNSDLPVDLITQEKPDVVVDEVVERRLRAWLTQAPFDHIQTLEAQDGFYCPQGTEINASKAENEMYFGTGWSVRQASCRWTQERDSVLKLKLKNIPARGMVLRLFLLPFIEAGNVTKQELILSLNGHAVQTMDLTDDHPQECDVLLPGNLLADTNLLQLSIPTCKAPLSGDGRHLGVALFWFKLDPVPDPAAD